MHSFQIVLLTVNGTNGYFVELKSWITVASLGKSCDKIGKDKCFSFGDGVVGGLGYGCEMFGPFFIQSMYSV